MKLTARVALLALGITCSSSGILKAAPNDEIWKKLDRNIDQLRGKSLLSESEYRLSVSSAARDIFAGYESSVVLPEFAGYYLSRGISAAETLELPNATASAFHDIWMTGFTEGIITEEDLRAAGLQFVGSNTPQLRDIAFRFLRIADSRGEMRRKPKAGFPVLLYDFSDYDGVIHANYVDSEPLIRYLYFVSGADALLFCSRRFGDAADYSFAQNYLETYKGRPTASESVELAARGWWWQLYVLEEDDSEPGFGGLLADWIRDNGDPLARRRAARTRREIFTEKLQ